VGHRRGWDKSTVVLLQTALLIAISAELFFCWYHSPYAWYNAAGHILKSIAYLCILSALFGSALHKPYSELSKARYRLRDLYRETRNSRNELETSFSRIGVALSSSVRVSEAAGIVAQLAREISRSDCAVIRIGSTTEVDSQQACSGNLGPCPRLIQLAEHYGTQAATAQDTIYKSFADNEMDTICMTGDVHPIRHVLSVCLSHESRILGTLSLFRRTNEEYKPRDVKLVDAFVHHAGIAISNAHSYEREQHIASILQESITRTASVAGERYDIGHFYKPLLEEASVGGDFLDVIKLPEGKIGLAVGDVAGKGLRAAVHTAMLKYALRAFLSEGHSPSQATQRLEKLVPDFVEDDKFITLFVAVLDTKTGTLTYTNAGHEPPILCKRNICGHLTSTGPALGLAFGQDFVEKTVHLEPKDTLVIFTDGLTERGGGHPDFSVDRVAHILIDNQDASCNMLVDSIYQASRSSESGELRDDVALLAIKAL
jgi:serine phosphatase RsbU (regulator of sigma subunit)